MALALVLSACGGGDGGDERRRGGDRVTPAVEAIQARSGALPLEERMSGLVRAENQVGIYPEVAAPVVRVAAQDGDYVKAGAPLVYLRDTQFQEGLRQAEASLRISQAEAKRAEATLRELRARLERGRQLADKQFQSLQELEALQAQVDIAEAGLEQAEARIAQAEATVEEQREALRRTVVRAPISGLVGQRDVEVGMRVDGSTRLFTMGNFDVVRVEVAIPDEMVGRIQTGQTALVRPEGGDLIRAEVSRISPFLDEGTYSAAAEIDVPNDDGRLRPGMFVAVDVLYGESEQATLLPASVLYEDPRTGATGVYVAPSLTTETPIREPETYDRDDPPALTEATPMTFQEVDVRARGRGLVGVDGVQPGDWVVTVGQNLLSGGDERTEARVRPITWERVVALQELQDQDLLRQFMEKQQRLAREAFGAEEQTEQGEQADSSTGQAGVPAAQAQPSAPSTPAQTTSAEVP